MGPINAVRMIVWLLLLIPCGRGSEDLRARLTTGNMRQWARRFSERIYTTASEATQVNELIKKYEEAGAYAAPLDPEEVVDEMKDRLERYLEKRKSLAKDLKEQLEISRETYDHLPHELINNEKDEINFYRYFDAKNKTNGVNIGERLGLRWVPETAELNYQKNPNFFNMLVDLQHTAVHVPTPIYPRNETIINEIRWSSILDEIVIDRRKRNFTSASWLFFCSKTGFMRYYPAAPWLFDRPNDNPPLDLYDCRNTEWFIDGATNSKNVVILLDISGSMLGQRFEIAKRTIDVILETLSENDFFNILVFNDVTHYLYKCFENRLVQATIRNKHLIRNALEKYKDIKSIANYESALPAAFELILQLNSTGCSWPYEKEAFTGMPPVRSASKKASDGNEQEDDIDAFARIMEEPTCVVENITGTRQLGCNSAIMLITDGADDFYEKHFQLYNPTKKVRFFSFLMGEDVTDFREVRWMACNNNGYFAHIANLADVQEKVQKYIDVMSRPLAQENETRAIWTGSYFDRLGRRLVTTVAYPVIFNKTFLGVVGAAAPIAELQQRAPVYMLGANSYTFLVDNNGYMLFHPQLRPMDKGLPKPNYNSMDIMEVEVADVHDVEYETEELMESSKDPVTKDRDRDADYVPKYTLKSPLNYSHELRSHLVDGISSKELTEKLSMTVLYAIDGNDGLKRIYRSKHYYYYRSVNNTLLSLGLAVPENAKFRVNSPLSKKFPMTEINEDWFEGTNWRLHPEWHYCRPNDSDVRDRETVFKDYVKLMKQGESLPEHCLNFEFLINRLLFDAKVTCEMDMCWVRKSKLDNKNGIMLAFLATQTGLTRFVDMNFADLNYDSSSSSGNDSLSSKCVESEQPYMHFIERSTRAADETFYKRAMQFQNDEFVFDVNVTNSVCLISNASSHTRGASASDRHTVLITASRSVFVNGPGGAKAPVGVVGMEMLYNTFGEMLRDATDQICLPGSAYFFCFLLDEHGYVVYANEKRPHVLHKVNAHVGQFFGKTSLMNSFLMQLLADQPTGDGSMGQGIYQKTDYIDFQAMCEEPPTKKDAAMRLLNPFISVFKFLHWVFKELIMSASRHLAEFSVWSIVHGLLMPAEAYLASSTTVSQLREMSGGLVCDRAHSYYLLNRTWQGVVTLINKTPSGCTKDCRLTAVAARIKNTNLVLLSYTVGGKSCPDACFHRGRFDDYEAKVVYNATDKVLEDDRCAVVRPRYRRAPSVCYQMENLDNSTAPPCSGARSSHQRLSFERLLLTLFISAVVAFVSTSNSMLSFR